MAYPTILRENKSIMENSARHCSPSMILLQLAKFYKAFSWRKY